LANETLENERKNLNQDQKSLVSQIERLQQQILMMEEQTK
jgi:hypothetical protein